MGSEGFSPSQTEVITPSLAKRMSVGMERRPVPSSEAMGKRGEVDEGRALIGAVRDLWTEEQRLVEERNTAVHVAEANMVAGKESVQERREGERLRREQEKKRQRTESAIFRGVLKKASPEDAAIISGQLGQPEGSVPTQEQIDQMAMRVLEQREVAQQRRDEIEKNRGERPNVSLEKDDKMANEIQLAQEEEVEAGLSVLRALETIGSDGGHTLDDLRKANVEGLRLAKAEKRRNRKVNALTRWLVTRYPDQEDEILEKRNQIDEERKSKKDALEPAGSEITDEARRNRAEALLVLADERFSKRETSERFGAEIGVSKDEEGNLTVVEGSVLYRRMQAEARHKALNEAYKSAMEKAKEDPRLADKVLELAIRRHQASTEVNILANEINARGLAIRAEEQADLQRERAQKQKDAKAEQRAQQRAEAVAWAKSKMEKAMDIPLRLFGRLMDKVGRFGQALERIGKVKEQKTSEEQLREDIAAAKARLEQLTAQLGATQIGKENKSVVVEEEEDFDLFSEVPEGEPVGQPVDENNPDGPRVMGAAATPEPEVMQPVVEATPEPPVAQPVAVPRPTETFDFSRFENVTRNATKSRGGLGPTDPNNISLGGE